MRDSCNRDITTLRISVTDRCNLRCRYCMPAEGVPLLRHEDILTYEQMTGIVRAGVGLGITKIRLTGGEPLVRRGIADLVAMIAGVEGLRHLGMTTNATLLAPLARSLRDAGLDSINISLDTVEPARYRALTRGGEVERALEGLDAALAAGLPVKINMVVLDDTTPRDIECMKSFAESRGARLQLINHFELGRRKEDQYVFDRPPTCDTCDRIRLTADGMLKPCLHSNTEVPVDFSRIEECLRAVILAKPRHGGACTVRTMSQIGG